MGDVHFIFECIQLHLEEQMGKDNFTQREMANSISQKIGENWEIMNHSSIASAILDPRTKLSVFSEDENQNVRTHKTIFETYQENASNTSSLSPMRRISTPTINTSRRYFAQLRQGTMASQVSTSTIFSTSLISVISDCR